MPETGYKIFLQSILKGIGIAAAGGSVALGAGTVNLVDVDFLSTVIVVVVSVLVNAGYQALTKLKK